MILNNLILLLLNLRSDHLSPFSRQTLYLMHRINHRHVRNVIILCQLRTIKRLPRRWRPRHKYLHGIQPSKLVELVVQKSRVLEDALLAVPGEPASLGGCLLVLGIFRGWDVVHDGRGFELDVDVEVLDPFLIDDLVDLSGDGFTGSDSFGDCFDESLLSGFSGPVDGEDVEMVGFSFDDSFDETGAVDDVDCGDSVFARAEVRELRGCLKPCFLKVIVKHSFSITVHNTCT